MVSAVFVYGSLLADDVFRALLSRVPPSSPAILPHYHRFSIKGRVYPAIIPAENKEVVGKLLMDITPSGFIRGLRIPKETGKCCISIWITL
ncbi:hypothetical protein ACS0TY_012063 [Phlomoides rotata]